MNQQTHWYKISFSLHTGEIKNIPVNIEDIDSRGQIYYGSSTVFVYSKNVNRGKKRLIERYRLQLEQEIKDRQRRLELLAKH